MWTIFHRDAAGRHADAYRERKHQGTCYISKDDDHNDDNANNHDNANDDDKSYDEDDDDDDYEAAVNIRDFTAQHGHALNEFASD